MSEIRNCFLLENFGKMKTLLRISALVSLVLLISMAGFSQGGTVGMKFSPHTGFPPSTSPYQAYYFIYDVTTGNTVENSIAYVVSPTQENDHQFNTGAILTSTDTYRFVAYVWDNSGLYSGYGSSATFTGAQYNLNPPTFKRNTDIIYL
jgi:hypothetical protein